MRLIPSKSNRWILALGNPAFRLHWCVSLPLKDGFSFTAYSSDSRKKSRKTRGFVQIQPVVSTGRRNTLS
jgi:hypothetical protein